MPEAEPARPARPRIRGRSDAAFGLGLSPLDGGRLAASLGSEPRLPLALLLLEHGDLLADRVVERPPLGEALLDLVASRGALGDDLTLPGKGTLDRLALPLDLGLGATDLIEDASVVFCHTAGRVEAVEQVVEAGRAEHDLDDVDLAALVELDESLVDRRPGPAQALLRDLQALLVDGELAFQLLQAQLAPFHASIASSSSMSSSWICASACSAWARFASIASGSAPTAPARASVATRTRTSVVRRAAVGIGLSVALLRASAGA